ncbi:RNA polymerase sigma factor [Roseibacillus persicicus]|uniref:DNA-directed RNA polymerase sigma-70 factor n=1 Tax=Roseibacillus persicicus TaxID=454148 RepID=A0A918TZ99_9BACT|nr:sigma-70 family RNA polymerase sigma factor [Roseibacillus persicicus]GHC65767.1 DNA-directed RNA polymerase sigma-70 factor [Roseibacillus persicicus]
MADEIRTRQTLLLRLRSPEDRDSWAEFTEIYTPLLYGYCQKRSISHADTADIVQDVMRSVSLAMANFEYDPARGKFKGWLFTAVRHAVGKHFRKSSRRPLSIAEISVLQAMDERVDTSHEEEWETDYQRQLLAWALEKIQPEFNPRIWQVFEATALLDKPPEEVASEFGMSKNAVAVAKSRVLQRLREKVTSVDAEQWEQDLTNNRNLSKSKAAD